MVYSFRSVNSLFNKRSIWQLGILLLAHCFLPVQGLVNEIRNTVTGHLENETFVLDDINWDKQYGSLILTNVIYRHGDRTPVAPYPLDPYKNLSYWPVGWGQLTNRGKEQHFHLGQWLRKRYGKFLSPKYSKQDILVLSTDVDRTLMSAESNLAGLYPPEPPQVWNPNVKWQPIPVHTAPEQQDELLAAKKPCPRYDTALREAKNSKQMQEINKKFATLYQYLTVHTGETISDVIGVEYVYNTLFIESLYNLTLPEWTKEVYPDKMAPAAALSFTVPTLTSELCRLKSGPLLGEITHHMQKKIDKKLTPDRKMFMYSAHDTTVANLLRTLHVFDAQSPPYTSTIMLDLWEKQQQYFVTVIFRNTSGEPYILKLPGCEQVCPYERFLDITRPFIPTNWEKECHVSNSFAVNLGLGEYPSIFVGLILFGVLIITVSVCFVMTLVNFRQNKSHFRYQRLPDTSKGFKFQTV